MWNMFLLQSRILYCVVNKLWNYLLENFVWHKFCVDRYMYKKVLYIIHSTYRYFFINQLQLVLIFVNVVNLVQLHLINTQISVCEDQGVWRSGCVKIRVCEEQGVWRPGCVKIRVCEDQGVWSGCVKESLTGMYSHGEQTDRRFTIMKLICFLSCDVRARAPAS